MGIVKEFKEFAMRGNVLDMAVGIIIGGAFGTIVKSLVEDVIMPPIGMVMNNVDFSDLKLLLTDKADGPAIKYGLFLNAVISFIIVAFAVFMMIKAMNTVMKKEEAKPAPPPGPTPDQALLGEIRDLLKKKA